MVGHGCIGLGHKDTIFVEGGTLFKHLHVHFYEVRLMMYVVPVVDTSVSIEVSLDVLRLNKQSDKALLLDEAGQFTTSDNDDCLIFFFTFL